MSGKNMKVLLEALQKVDETQVDSLNETFLSPNDKKEIVHTLNEMLTAMDTMFKRTEAAWMATGLEEQFMQVEQSLVSLRDAMASRPDYDGLEPHEVPDYM